MERRQSDSVFDGAKGSINIPTHGVERFEFIGGIREICDDGLKGRVGYFKANDTKAQGKK